MKVPARKFGLLVFGGAILLLFAEGALRLVAKLTGDVRAITFDSELGWRFVPGVVTANPQWSDKLPVTINSLGWRDAEFPSEKIPGRTRVLALGDSFTFGTGVDYGQRFSEVLERAEPSVDVLNMGAFAYGPEQEIRVYEVHGASVRPDIVLWNLYLGNDMEDIRAHSLHGVPKPYFSFVAGSLYLTKPERTAWTVARSHSLLAERVFRLLEWALGDGQAISTRSGANELNLLLALVRRLSLATKDHGSELLIVIIHPKWAAPEERRYQADISAALRRAGADVLDLRHVFPIQGEPSVDDFYLSDGHWRPAGHALFAEVLRKDLTARGWLNAHLRGENSGAGGTDSKPQRDSGASPDARP